MHPLSFPWPGPSPPGPPLAGGGPHHLKKLKKKKKRSRLARAVLGNCPDR